MDLEEQVACNQCRLVKGVWEPRYCYNCHSTRLMMRPTAAGEKLIAFMRLYMKDFVEEVVRDRFGIRPE